MDNGHLEKLVMQRIDALENITDMRFKAAEEALNLKSKELDRRLDALNGEAGRIAKVLEQSIPREVFDNYKKEMDVKINDLKESTSTSKGKTLGFSTGLSLLIGIGGFIGIILTIILNLRGH